MRRLISSGSPLEAAVGYSRAVVDSEWIFVAGTTGFDYAQMTIAEDPAEQARQAFRNIEQALTEAGGTLADLDRTEFKTNCPHGRPVHIQFARGQIERMFRR